MSIDVTDIVLDPDLGGHCFDVLREVMAVGDDGLRRTAWQKHSTAVGSIQPAMAEDLKRLPEAERVSGTIVVRTPFSLTAGQDSTTADVVWWQGTHYTVVSADPWAFGQGWTQALCVARPLRGETTARP